MTNADKLELALKALKKCEDTLWPPDKPIALPMYYEFRSALTNISTVHSDLLAADVAKRKADIKADKLPPTKGT